VGPKSSPRFLVSKRLLDHDPLTGVSEYFSYDASTDTSYIETTQDVEPILDVNKTLQNDPDYSKDGIKKEMWHYAQIPIVVQMKWLNEYGPKNWPMLPQNKQLLFRLLNSRDYKYLKCTEKIHTSSG
jgi:hypothetical protein